MIGLETSDKILRLSMRPGASRLLGAVGLAVGLALAGSPAQAGPVKAHTPGKMAKKVVKLASKDPETTGSIRSDADDGLNCDRSRKRLFVEGEGWIIRPVTTCY